MKIFVRAIKIFIILQNYERLWLADLFYAQSELSSVFAKHLTENQGVGSELNLKAKK